MRPVDQVLMPGIIAHTTAVVEHPEIATEQVIAGHTVGVPRGIAPAPASDRHLGDVRGAGRGGMTRFGAPVAVVAPSARPSPQSAAGERRWESIYDHVIRSMHGI
jgi:hypothetical protein